MRISTPLIALALFVCLASTISAAKIDIDAVTLKKWGEAQYVFSGKLESVVSGPTGLSNPPLYSTRLEFVVDQVLRGPVKKGDRLKCVHSARQQARPVFPEGKVCLVSASASRGSVVVKAVEELSDKSLAKVKLACSIPIGWTISKGQLVSPWAGLGDKAWVGDLKSGIACGKSGRPALLCGDGIAMSVSKVDLKKAIKWTNPDGDGEYTITLSNTSKVAKVVPALLTDGKKILWEECVVILCQGKVYKVPGSKGISGDVKAVTLKPGESISTVVNALKLKGPEWPRGGYRIAFQFAIGELSSVQSFYYMSRHHDKIRAAVQGK